MVPRVAGVDITHPDRVIFPAPRTTKLDLAHYYERLADWIVPHVNGRPLTLVRCPEGLGRDGRGPCFFMKHSQVWAPAALRRVRIREKTKVGEYLIADSPAGVVALVQMGVVEIHTWNTRFERVEYPDRLVIDLDPGARVTWTAAVNGGRIVRQVLQALGLQSFVKTTGGRGLHVVVPIDPVSPWSECLAFARALADALARTHAQFTTRFAKAGREELLLIDYLRNNRTNTSIAAFSTRARPGAPVSTPLSWTELSPARPPERFTITTVPARLARLRRDPWREYWSMRQRLPRGAAAALQRL